MKKKKSLFKEISQHLRGDIKDYKKERAHLKKEIKEDKDLKKKLKGRK